MSRTTKIVLVVASTLLASCCMLAVAAVLLLPRFFSNAISEDPQRIRQIASQIVDYTLPSGYAEQFGLDFFTSQAVIIGRPDRRGLTITLMQFTTAGTNREQMEQQMRRVLQNQFQRDTGALTPVGTEKATIKGQPIELTISEGSGPRGDAVRQITGFFGGKNGTVMLMAYGNTVEWNKTLLDNFFESLR
jgi:hypothetical protein